MKKTICSVLCGVLLCSFLFCGESKETKHHREGPERRHETPPSTPSKSKKKSEIVADTLLEALGEIFVELLIDVGIETDILAVFDEYPYATSDFYIQYEGYQNPVFPSRVGRYSVDFGTAYYLNSDLSVTKQKFEGFLFKFIGPFVENTSYKSMGNYYNPYLGNIKLGLQFAGLQTFAFSWIWNFEWFAYYGRNFIQGGNVGFNIISYPVRPVILEYKLNVGFLDNSTVYYDNGYDETSTIESTLRAGVMLYDLPWEIYVAWNYLLDGPLQVSENTLGLGVKYHF